MTERRMMHSAMTERERGKEREREGERERTVTTRW